jgi:hypothetical protein
VLRPGRAVRGLRSRDNSFVYLLDVLLAQKRKLDEATAAAGADPEPCCACDAASGDCCPVHEQPEDDLDPYCAACGALVGIFRGHGDGWRHYRGEGTVASPVELYDAGHEPAVAWREPAGAAL